jgi:cytochrome c oxidase subunit 3
MDNLNLLEEEPLQKPKRKPRGPGPININIFYGKRPKEGVLFVHGPNTHPYHIVSTSPWPILTAMNLLVLVIGGTLYLHFYQRGLDMFNLAFIHLIFCLIGWWYDVIYETTYQAIHTSHVQKGLRIGMLLFIVSEIMFFFAFFWAFFHSSLSPAIQIGAIWPPIGIHVFNPWEIPLLNTMILLFSGASATVAHHIIKAGINSEDREAKVLETLGLAIISGLIFTGFQVYEYIIAPFAISDGIYGSVFYLATGFHGFHVLIGTTFLIVILLRLIRGHFGGYAKYRSLEMLLSAKTSINNVKYIKRHFFGVDAAIWYWHFVDVVWLFLFVSIYWWGS